MEHNFSVEEILDMPTECEVQNESTLNKYWLCGTE